MKNRKRLARTIGMLRMKGIARMNLWPGKRGRWLEDEQKGTGNQGV